MRKFNRRQLILTPATILVVAGFAGILLDAIPWSLFAQRDHYVWIWLPYTEYRIRLILETGGHLVVRSYFGTWSDSPYVMFKVSATTMLIGYGLLLTLIPDLLRSDRTARRIAADHCATCDYDLKANTTGVCPECGTPINSEKAHAR